MPLVSLSVCVCLLKHTYFSSDAVSAYTTTAHGLRDICTSPEETNTSEEAWLTPPPHRGSAESSLRFQEPAGTGSATWLTSSLKWRTARMWLDAFHLLRKITFASS